MNIDKDIVIDKDIDKYDKYIDIDKCRFYTSGIKLSLYKTTFHFLM